MDLKNVYIYILHSSSSSCMHICTLYKGKKNFSSDDDEEEAALAIVYTELYRIKLCYIKMN